MKNKRVLVLVFLALLVVTMMGPRSVTAEAIQKEFTGTEIFVEEIDPGIWDYLPNGGSHLRGQIAESAMNSTDSRVSGTATVIMNANLDANLTGPFWGSFVLTVEPFPGCSEGGSWEGTFAGKISYTQFYAYYHAVIQGVSGCVEGMKASIDEDCFAGTYSGTLLDPHGE